MGILFVKNNKLPTTNFTLNAVELIKGGKPYFDLLLLLINNARQSIHLQTYIFDEDETGRSVANALREAAGRGVQIYLLVDGYASQNISKKFIVHLQQAKINFRFFEPFFKNSKFYFGRRLHQKIFVADGKQALVGGINISNKYNDMPQKPAWLDFAVYVQGIMAKELCVLCWKTWNGFPIKMDITPCEEQQLFFDFENKKTAWVSLQRNDWVRKKNEISATYIHLLRQAQSQIIIMCSYFLPGKFVRRLLAKASKRGVQIIIITAGKSDVAIAKNAERWMYDWILRNKILLYEYQPNILHAKIAVCDKSWLTVGSYNVNNISAYASIELNLNIKDVTFAEDAALMLQNIIKNDCIAITDEINVSTKNIFKQFARWCSYQFVSVVFYLLTFYFKREK